MMWFSWEKREWLLVFDNADGDPSVISKFIPPGDRGNIIFTSRNRDMRRNADESAEVDMMEEDDAITLLLRAAFIEAPSASDLMQARDIVRELCCLPLAVDQAGAAIASGRCTIDDYLPTYWKYRKELLTDPHFLAASNYGQVVYSSFELSYQTIKAKAGDPSNLRIARAANTAICILRVFAFFHHENIFEDIFRRAAVNQWSPIEALRTISLPTAEASPLEHLPNPASDETRRFRNAPFLLLDDNGAWDRRLFRTGIQLLQSFSLVKIAASGTSYSIHPLVHCWIRDRMSKHQLQIMCGDAGELLSHSITYDDAIEDYTFRSILVPHVKGYQKYMAEQQLQGVYKKSKYIRFAWVLRLNGYWKEAEALQIQVVNTDVKTLGFEHRDTACSFRKLAAIYLKQHMWDRAEHFTHIALGITQRCLGVEDPDTLTTMTDLAAAYTGQNRWKEAEQLEFQVLEIRMRTLGPEDPDTLEAMECLADTYCQQGLWNKAEQFEVQVLEIRKRTLGLEDPDTLDAKEFLAETYCQLGRWIEAEQFEIEVLEVKRRAMGLEHPDTLSSINKLAHMWYSLERVQEAIDLIEQAVASQRKVLGSEHPDTVLSVEMLREWREDAYYDDL